MTHRLPRLLLALAALFCPAFAQAAKPIFVIISIDDLDYADIGLYGSDNRTLHLDRMAAEGRLLTSHYAAPVCTPSRAALLTGCYPKRVLPMPGFLFPAGAVGLHPNEVTIADVLRQSGYATACIGKWHLGDQPEFLPTRQGFDHYFGIPYSNDMGPAEDGAKSNPGQPLPDPGQAAAKAAAANQQTDETGLRGFAQPPMPLLENETVVGRVRVEEQFAVTRRYTERAVRFIRQHKDQPFFLYLPQTAVHFPLYPSEPFVGKSPNGLIGDWTEEVDWSVGQVLDTVRELGLDQNTFEGGMRVCTIAWWPNKIPAGTRTDAITSMMDLLPTLANLAGAKLPDDRKLDGVDQWAVLADTAQGAPPRHQFYSFRSFRLEAVRFGPWKLHLALAGNAEGQKKPLPRPQLFHLIDDDLGRDGIGPGCRPLGRVAEPLPAVDHNGTVRPDMAGDIQRFP